MVIDDGRLLIDVFKYHHRRLFTYVNLDTAGIYYAKMCTYPGHFWQRWVILGGVRLISPLYALRAKCCYRCDQKIFIFVILRRPCFNIHRKIGGQVVNYEL